MTEQLSRENEQDGGATVAGQPVRPLPVGHRIGELQIEAMLGGGGFGIVYRAFDIALQRVVAIKEYMPTMLAVRHGDQTVSLRSERFAQAFDAGRSAFLNEARLLAQFDHPGLVKVLHFGASHGTAYMVTPFYEGRTLKQLLDSGMQMGEAQLREITAALLGALDTLHRAQCFHRDISLDNILIRPDGQPVLLDFGAARKQIGDLVDDSAMMLKPGYAPIEQYTDDPAFSQGPWTDLYALGAVMHAMVTGEIPPAAVVRSIQDSYQPLASRRSTERERYSQPFLAAIDHALRLRIAERPESVAQFALELGLKGFEAEVRAPADEAKPVVAAGGVSSQASESMPPSPAKEPEPTSAVASEHGDAAPKESVDSVAAEQTQTGKTTQATQATPSEPEARATVGAGSEGRASTSSLLRRKAFYLGAALFVLVCGVAVVHFAKSGKTTQEPATLPARSAPAITAAAKSENSAPSASSASAPQAQTVANQGTPAASLDASEAIVAAPPPASVSQTTVATVSVPAPAASQAQQQQQPQQEPKPVGTVSVRFHVRPWGEIYVNGVRRGASPPLRSLPLSPGVYQLEIRNGTLTPLRRMLTIDVGSKPVIIDYVFE